MSDKLMSVLNRIKDFLQGRTLTQKVIMIVMAILLVGAVTFTTYFATKTNYVTIFRDQTPQSIGEAQAALDKKGTIYKVVEGGTAIQVPEKQSNALVAELATQGIPSNGYINYKKDVFGSNSMTQTDDQFDLMNKELLQSEIANLMTSMQGIQSANVVLNVPLNTIFLEQAQEASAAVQISLKQGVKLTEDQVKGLFQIVSRSMKGLPIENISIVDQYMFAYEPNIQKDGNGPVASDKYELQKKIERDTQNNIQQMFSMMLGQNKVFVTVTANVDVSKTNTTQNLVEPVDKENNKGVDLSKQTISEEFVGTKPTEGTTGTGDEEVANYLGGTDGSNGDYKRIEETVNSEVNRIQNEIIASPYKVSDLSIQMIVEPPDPTNPESLTQATKDQMAKVLGQIVRTTVDDDENLTEDDITNRIVILPATLSGVPVFDNSRPWWVYALAVGIPVLLILVLVVFILTSRRRKTRDDAERKAAVEAAASILPLIEEIPETEETLRRKQLEKLANEKPEEFARLLRSWMVEE